MMSYVWGAVALALLALGYHFGGLEAEGDYNELVAAVAAQEAARANATVQASEDARSREKASQERVERLAAAYEKDKQNAQDSSNRTIDDLRRGNLKLRQHWQAGIATDRLADSAEAARYADELAQLRAEGARDLVRVGEDADAQVRALQAYAREVSGG